MRIIVMRDDLDHESEVDETLPFYIDGVTYVLDLSAEHAAELRDVLAPYMKAAHDKFRGHEPRRNRKNVPAPLTREVEVVPDSIPKRGPTLYESLTRDEKAACRAWWAGRGNVLVKGALSTDIVNQWRASLELRSVG